MWKDYYFWFEQPDLAIIRFDMIIAYSFLASLVLGIVLWIATIWIKHNVIRKVLNKIKNLVLSLGVAGLIWFAFRFEQTPVFAKRFWPAFILLLGFIWFIWIIKYLIFNFAKEKKEFDQELVKSKYLPGSKK